MKLAGFITGVLVAVVGVTAFNSWRHVSDDDRLTGFLADHCLPYVMNEVVPFDGIGRSPGVYDDFEPREGLRDGGVRLLEGNRFGAEWGYLDNVGPNGDVTTRLCDVKATYAENTVAGFEVEAEGFVARYTDVIAEFEALVPDTETLTEGPIILGWFGPQPTGLRVVMTASPGLVSGFISVVNVSD